MLRFLLFCSVLWVGCSTKKEEITTTPRKDLLFELQPGSKTGISFSNDLKVTEDFDVFRYRNFYNGAGVGIGDINNDSLPDIYFTSNMGDNRLFLNKGNWQFEDITQKAGIKGSKIWSTGVSMADVNADGWLDIYVCNSGDVKGGHRENELFINNRDGTFTDRAAEYGLDDPGFSTHAAFFDYDKDGDLDCYVLNNSFKPVSSLGYANLRDKRDYEGGDRLYQNVKGKFVDVSEKAGIFGSVIGFGLGITIGDVNNDNWPDMYISNDFYERDYLYINSKDGTFSEELEKRMGHLGMFSMGADVGDINNDGCLDIFSTDMLPESDYRLKTMTAFETYDVYQLRLQNGYYHQFMRNMLQLNNHDGNFLEVGQLAGVDATDWSWGALIADFNNDSNKEIFVSNGINKDVTDQDFVEYLGSSEELKAVIEGKDVDYKKFIDRMASNKLSNYMYSRDHDLHFKNVSSEWGLDEPSFSNGAAYGDIDNDGDLDLVVNNVNHEAFVYRNFSREKIKNNFVTIRFEGVDGNTKALGTTVRVFAGNQLIMNENMPIRGFQSSMDYKMVVGLGTATVIDSIEIIWPDQQRETMRNVAVNSNLVLKQKAGPTNKGNPKKNAREAVLLKEIKTTTIEHKENKFNDFDRDRLQYNMLSSLGPAFAKCDLNNDGNEDFFIGGSVGEKGKIYLQRSDFKFEEVLIPAFEVDASCEDVAAAFFDADGDSDMDLYVVSGGSEHLAQSTFILDRLYLNAGIKNGKPTFEKTKNRIPPIFNSGSCVKPFDFENDGDVDLFIGRYFTPSYYGLPVTQALLLNDGKGNFSDATQAICPAFKKLGMVTDAEVFDYDNNGFQDLFIVGEWMPATIFLNDGKKMTKAENVKGFEKSNGWWNCITKGDIDNDGDQDFIVGNLGLNSKFRPSASNPISLYVNDFDQNGSVEPIYSFLKDGKEYPFALRQDIIKQMSSLKKKFVLYKDYADKTLLEIFDKEAIQKSVKLEFFQPNTSVFLNRGKDGFSLFPLPVEAQFAPVYAISVTEINNDNVPDIVIGGNLYDVKPEVGRYDALKGLVLIGKGDGTFISMSSNQSGLFINGQIRAINTIRSKSSNVLTFVLNNDSMKFYQTK